MDRRIVLLTIVLAIAAATACLFLNRFASYLAYSVAIAGIGALSLNLLNGLCGQISFSQAALLGVGAYTAGNLGNAGFGVWSLLAGALMAAFMSGLIGLPSLRLRGLYFAISTLATQFLFEYAFKILEPITHGVSGLIVQPLKFGGKPLSEQAFAALTVVILALVYLACERIRHWDIGRAFLVVRENEIVARGMGVNVARAKLAAFVISGFFAGLAGGLLAFATRLASPEAFGLSLSVDYVAMIIVGGLGSLPGSLLGAAFVTLLPEAIQRLGESLHLQDALSALREMAFGLLMILFLIFEPRGLSSLLRGKWSFGAQARSSNQPSVGTDAQTDRTGGGH